MDITAIEVNDSPQSITKLVIDERYSRIPVYKDSIDNIIGILHTRDYLEALALNKEPDLKKLMKSAFYIYKTKKLSVALAEFKKQRHHMAVVTDDYGGTLGIVTMEDLLEEIVGDIWDEDEDETPEYRKISATTYSVSGDMKISDMLELFDLREDYIVSDSVSVGGFVMENLGDIPESGDSFTYKDTLSFTVISTVEQRVEQVKIVYIPEKNSKE